MDSHNILSQFTNTQKSIVPSKKKIQTIQYDASPQQLNWQIPDDKEMEQIEKSLNMPIEGRMTRGLSKKKSSTFSITDIKNSAQRVSDNGGLFDKSASNTNQLQNLSQIYNLGNINNDDHEVPNLNDFNIDNMFRNPSQNDILFLRSNSRNKKPIPIRRPIPEPVFGRSSSAISYNSNIDIDANRGIGSGQHDGVNLLSHLRSSLNADNGGSGFLRIQANDLNRFDIDENNIINLPEMPNISSRGNSYNMMLRNDPTPALFRNASSVIDPKILRKN